MIHVIQIAWVQYKTKTKFIATSTVTRDRKMEFSRLCKLSSMSLIGVECCTLMFVHFKEANKLIKSVPLGFRPCLTIAFPRIQGFLQPLKLGRQET